MRLIIVYVLLVLVGELIAIQVGFFFDYAAPSLSLPIALGLFFSVLWLMWPLAVYVTERWWNPEDKTETPPTT
jgi:hypothetical protein